MFETLEDYFEGDLSSEQTIKIINCMHYSNQIVIKNQKYIDDKIHIPDEKPNRLHVKKDKIILICLGRILLMQINLREKLDV